MTNCTQESFQYRQWNNVLNVLDVEFKLDSYLHIDGNHLSGESSYKLQLPAGIPAANFWSITLYDGYNASG